MNYKVLKEFENYCNKMKKNGIVIKRTVENLKTFEVSTYKLIELQRSLNK